MKRWLRSRRLRRAVRKGHSACVTGAGAFARPGERFADEATLCVLRPLAAAWRTSGHQDIRPLGTGTEYTGSFRRHRLGG